jgi:hypothetical protein
MAHSVAGRSNVGDYRFFFESDGIINNVLPGPVPVHISTFEKGEPLL